VWVCTIMCIVVNKQTKQTSAVVNTNAVVEEGY